MHSHPLHINPPPPSINLVFIPTPLSLRSRHCFLPPSHETSRSCTSIFTIIIVPFYQPAMEVVLRLTESQSRPYYEPPQQHADSSRPTLSFPLGTALLLIIIFSLSGFFSCCYHWDKLRHLRGSFSNARPDSDDNHDSPYKPNPTFSEKNRKENQSLPVIMPGDRIAKFIALPCPCEPPRQEKIIVEEVQKPPKPPHIVVPMY